MANRSQSPLLYDYLRRYQQDPTSRVFAPLAEAYRKAGLVDQAIEIAREGLRVHPGFVGGRVALSRALFDKHLYEDVIDELSPVIQDVPDNLVAQRLLAESYLMLGRVAESLGCYKMLLYFNPGDPETGKIVQELEAQAYEKGSLVLRTDPPAPDPIPDFGVREVKGAFDAAPSVLRLAWVRKVELLQDLLQRVERYRARVDSHG